MSERARIDSLVVRFEELRERGTPVSAEELCRDCPELLAELKQQLHVLDSMNALLGDAGSDEASSDLMLRSTDPASPAAAVPPAAVAAATRYRVLRLHARGGLGEVLVAHDEVLRRDVALKRLQAPHTDNAESRSRFVREAEITSRLEHPSIVPVHAVGRDAEGRPFYVMRFIRGETLRQASQHFHAADQSGRDPTERRLALRQLLSRFVAVCNSVAYAHSQGIVHRDIKPDNIILGPFGETLLIDWGLAKQLGPSPSSPGETAEPAGQDDGDAGARPRPPTPTRDGAVLGTPAFMSPEQTTGRSEEVGPASDIYSLGATLYLLITGFAPFQGRQVPEILDRVRRGDFVAPRQRTKRLPLALDGICRKAMARRPEDRYETAQALASDVEHWLADEPVSAWPEPWSTRLRRWGSRHRTLVAVGAAAVAVALVCLTAATALLNAASQREREARGLAERNARVAQDERHTAEQNLQLARQAVDRYCRSVALDPRLREHDLEDLRSSLLGTAARFCDEFVRRQSDDPEVQADQGRAYLLLGFITDEMSAKPEAITHYQKARDIFAALAQANPTAADYRRELAQSHDHLGKLFAEAGRPTAARQEYITSLHLREELLRTDADDADYQNEVAASHHLLGLSYQDEREWDRAREELDRSIDLRKKLLRTHPGVLAYEAGLADVHNNLAIVYRALHQPRRVEEELVQVLTTWQERARLQPGDMDVCSRLATSHFNLGVLYADQHRTDEAESAYQKALDLREELVRTHPTITDYQSKLAHTYHNQGVLYQENKRPVEAEATFAKALAIHKKLIESHPTVIAYAVALGKTYCHLGYVKMNKPQEALDSFDQAAQTHESVLQRQPGEAAARESLGHVHAGRALALGALQRYAEAVAEWDQAVELAGGPQRDDWQLRRALTLNRVGDHGRASAAAAVLAERASLPLINLYTLACIQGRAATLALKDEKLAVDERKKLAEDYGAQAVKLLRRLQAAGQLNGPERLAQLQKEPALASLRSRGDFQSLLEELEASPK
jgi:serine/threonine-protein kinase